MNQTAPQATPQTKIRLMKHFATNGVAKARCRYSYGSVLVAPDFRQSRECVTIYAKDYSDNLAEVFGAEAYINQTDMMSDYFEKGRVRIFPENPLWAEAVARSQKGA